MGTLIVLEGKLKGFGVEAKCEVLVRRLTINSAIRPLVRGYAYTDCSIIGAPAELPDGEYVVYFDGHRFAAAIQRGLWFSRGPVTKINALKPTLVA